jgi:hypothetical protein
METPAQDVPGYYVWQVPGQPVIVQIRLDLVDRLAAEVMRGFGAVPKRGAEVGGILLGTIQPGFPAIVRVDDFEPVTCQYRRGPSYLFTEEDGPGFEEAHARGQAAVSPSSYAVGYFRSHTRDEEGLGAEDIELMDHFFPDPSSVALVIKPYATRVSMAGFFVREHGKFPTVTPLEFPFRRRELLGEEAPARRSLMERGERGTRRPRLRDSESEPREESPQRSFDYTPPSTPPPAPSTPAPSASGALRRNWLWIPLSFVFLLLGVAVGFQAALTMGTRVTGSNPQDFSLALAISKSDENLSVKWDRLSPAIKTARKGLLEIEDGGFTKPVELDAAQLQNGALIYRNSSNTVNFKLTVYPNGRTSITETLSWHK